MNLPFLCNLCRQDAMLSILSLTDKIVICACYMSISPISFDNKCVLPQIQDINLHQTYYANLLFKVQL